MANITWQRSTPTDTVIGANGADDILAGWNTVITANAANADFKWEVASYVSASPKSLLLRRKDGSAGRIIMFGQQGSTPHANSVRVTGAASSINIGYSATSAVNVVDASWLVGAPLAAADYMPAVRGNTMAASTYRFSYMDTQDGIWFTSTSTGSGLAMMGAGDLVTGLDGSKLPTIYGSGATFSTSWWSNISSQAGSLFDPVVSTNTYTNSNPGLVVRYLGANILVFRWFGVSNNATTMLLNTAGTKAYFFPIVLLGNTSDLTQNVIGKLTQVAFGPNSLREATLSDGTTAGTAYGHAYHPSAISNAIWFTNTEI